MVVTHFLLPVGVGLMGVSKLGGMMIMRTFTGLTGNIRIRYAC